MPDRSIEKFIDRLRRTLGNKGYMLDLSVLLSKVPELTSAEKSALEFLARDIEQLEIDKNNYRNNPHVPFIK